MHTQIHNLMCLQAKSGENIADFDYRKNVLCNLIQYNMISKNH